MSHLRRRMIEDIRSAVSAEDQQGYICAHHGLRVPRPGGPNASFEDVRRFQDAFAAKARTAPLSNPHRGCVAVLSDHAQALRHHRAHDVHSNEPGSAVVPVEEVAAAVDAAAGAQNRQAALAWGLWRGLRARAVNWLKVGGTFDSNTHGAPRRNKAKVAKTGT